MHELATCVQEVIDSLAAVVNDYKQFMQCCSHCVLYSTKYFTVSRYIFKSKDVASFSCCFLGVLSLFCLFRVVYIA